MVTIKTLINAENTCYWQSHYKFCRDINEWWRFTSAVFYLIGGALRQCYNPPGGTPYNGLYGEAPPERGIFFRLQVYERVGNLSFGSVKRPKGLICEFYGFIKSRKPSTFKIDSYSNDSAFTAVKRMQSSKQCMCKGHYLYLSLEGTRKGTFFVKNGI